MKIKIEFPERHDELSDDDIRRYMNFEEVLAEARRRRAGLWSGAVWVLIPVALALVAWWFLGAGAQQTELPASGDLQHTASKSDPPGPSPGEVIADSIRQPPLNEPSIYPATTTPQRHAHDKAPSSRITPGTRDSLVKAFPEPDVYQQAEPLQGYTHLYQYFNENLAYPSSALPDSLEGIETVSFTIDAQGHPTRIVITQSLGPAFDQEATRLIQGMPAWKPATLNGRPIASQLSVPLKFQIEGKKP